MQKAIYIIILQFSFLLSAPAIHPMVKSVLIPGWGEANLGYEKNSRFFLHSETILVVSCLSVYKMAQVKENEYIAYANEHAGAENINNHRYWVDIGNYDSNYAFDEEHLRMRDGKEGQWSSYPWYWEGSDTRRKRFEKMRINSDKLFFTGRFLIGGIILNHIISGIDALYLSRIIDEKSYSISPKVEYINNNIRYLLSLKVDI